MTKIYVLDTSVIVSDPNCLDSFPNEHIIIQAGVLNELDDIKTHPGNIGRNARIFIRLLDELSNKGDIKQGVKTDTNVTLQINTENYDTSEFGVSSYIDNKILACAKQLNLTNDVTVISADINMRVRAKIAGMHAQNYESENKHSNDLYSGSRIIHNTESGNRLKKLKIIECVENELDDMMPNECVFFKDENDNGISLGRKIDDNIKLISGDKPWGLESRNIEQAYAIDLLLDPKIPLVTLSGTAGTGKSLVAVACGLETVINKSLYNNMMIYRPIQPVGTDMGFLPGELSAKLEPWMAAIHDSLDFLTSRSKKQNKKNVYNQNSGWKNALAQYEDKICMEALTYIRGRSIQNVFMLIDEVQNISKEEIKTILTRVGNGTKIILTGDIEQIDTHHLDAVNNGLTYVINKFKESPLAGHVNLTKGERSPLATIAAEIL
jgi:PhoH-like ATPase